MSSRKMSSQALTPTTSKAHMRSCTYHHLTYHATEDSLREYGEVAINAEGYPKLQSVGRKIMEELEQGGWLSCMCTHACVCA